MNLWNRFVASLACAVLVTACGSEGSSTSEPVKPKGPSLTISPFTIRDTIQTSFASPLVITVRDASGALARFDSVTASSSLLVAAPPPFSTPIGFSLDRNTPGQVQFKTITDSAGRLELWMKASTTAGPIRVRISSRFGKDSLDGTILPGHPVRFLITPRDTALYAGASVTPVVTPRDRFSNNTTDPVALTARRPAVLDVAGNALSARTIGRAFIDVAAGEARDSIGISVVPTGTLVAYNYLYSSADVASFFTFNLDGSGYRVFARGIGGSNDRGLRWSAAQDRVVFHDPYPPYNLGRSGLYSVTLTGTPQQLLSPLTVSDGTSTGNDYASAVYPSVSADGTMIYFAGTSTYAQTSIWRVKADGTGAVRVGPLSGTGVADSQPTVSPDGKRLVYITNGGNFGTGGTRLMLLDLTTGVSLSMATLGVHPSWSPNSDEIAYFANGVSVIRADGTGERVVAAAKNFDANGGQIDWSPDGKWLVTCVTGPVLGARLIVVINRVTGELLPLPFTAKDNLCEATWKA